MTRAARCWLCGKAGQALTDEHVLSEANFGGRLVAPKRVCQPCNRKAGHLEGEITTVPPLVQFAGEAADELRPNRPRYPEAEAILNDGARGRAAITPEGARIVSFEPRKVGMEGDVEVWEVGEGDEEKFERRRRDQGQCVKAVGRPLGQGGYPRHLGHAATRRVGGGGGSAPRRAQCRASGPRLRSVAVRVSPADRPRVGGGALVASSVRAHGTDAEGVLAALEVRVPLRALTRSVLASIEAALEALGWRESVNETELRAVMSWPGDDRRHADLNVFFVPTPPG